MHRIGHWIGGDRVFFECVDCGMRWSEMIIYYDWNYCDTDHQQCVRGRREECPQDERGILGYCEHFHIEKKEEDVET